MMPTGSWPTVRPGATGYSPFKIWTSVPQIVVVVILTKASSGPTSGMGFSTISMRFFSIKAAAWIMVMVTLLFASWALLGGGYGLCSMILGYLMLGIVRVIKMKLRACEETCDLKINAVIYV